MARRNSTHQQVPDETAELRTRLEETEETLHAIRQYLVDAFVVNDSDSAQVVTLSDADFPYRLMVESMNEGAVTLIADGTIFYCNPRFSEMVQLGPEKLIGARFQDLILPEEQASFDGLFVRAGRNGARGEFCLKKPDGNCVPVQLSLHQLGKRNNNGISMSIIATDLTERVEAEEKIRSLAAKLTIAEQEERHRISQILHDDLQQHLFAIKAQLALLRNASEDNQEVSALADIDQIGDWLARAIYITRNLSINLNPVVLQGEGLTEAIHRLSSQMGEQHGLEVDIEAKEDFQNLDDHMRVLLFQAVRELLFNIVKHAGTLKAIVTLEQVDQRANITVCDEGKGFDVDKVMSDPKLAHGLLVMQDRLGLMGCSIEIISTPGNGTKIVIGAPLNN